MSSRISSVMDLGDAGASVDVECNISRGLPAMQIVGMATRAVDEAKERVRSAFSNSHLEFPKQRVIINLAPADLPKDSPHFDLAMALAILLASGQISPAAAPDAAGTVFFGELGLDGSVRPLRGIIGKLLIARRRGYKTAIVPLANLSQATLVPGINVIPAANLRDVYLHVGGTLRLPVAKLKTTPPKYKTAWSCDFADISGQARAKRALEIAAAGAHNILLNGPPGTGKSMLARAVPSILPPLLPEEMLEVTHLHSLAGKEFNKVVTERPFRAPHHSSSLISIVGGGSSPRPGEVTLSHQGVLFFDEFPEFARSTLEALRQPMEDGTVTIARARDNTTFPARFMLIATSNPCPCGYWGSQKECTCLPYQIIKYQRRLSGPIIDRIDLFAEVTEIQHDQLLNCPGEESSSKIQDRVIKGHQRQRQRYGRLPLSNSQLSNRQIKQYVSLDSEASALLNRAAQKLDLSARSYMRIIKVSQTIADLEGSRTVQASHIGEALQYRRSSPTVGALAMV